MKKIIIDYDGVLCRIPSDITGKSVKYDTESGRPGTMCPEGGAFQSETPFMNGCPSNLRCLVDLVSQIKSSEKELVVCASISSINRSSTICGSSEPASMFAQHFNVLVEETFGPDDPARKQLSGMRIVAADPFYYHYNSTDEKVVMANAYTCIDAKGNDNWKYRATEDMLDMLGAGPVLLLEDEISSQYAPKNWEVIHRIEVSENPQKGYPNAEVVLYKVTTLTRPGYHTLVHAKPNMTEGLNSLMVNTAVNLFKAVEAVPIEGLQLPKLKSFPAIPKEVTGRYQEIRQLS